MMERIFRLVFQKPNTCKHDRLDDEFDVIESDPDSASESEVDSEPDEQVTKADIKDKDKSKQSDKKNKDVEEIVDKQLKRIREIESTKVGLKEFLQCLDWSMLGLFVKGMLAYFTIGGILCLIFLCFVYKFNEQLWYEYFPAEDISDLEEDKFQRILNENFRQEL